MAMARTALRKSYFVLNLSDMNWNAAILRETIKAVPNKFARVSETVRPKSNLTPAIARRMRNNENTQMMLTTTCFPVWGLLKEVLPPKKPNLRPRTRRILAFIVEVGQVLRRESLSPNALSRNGRPKARMRTTTAESSIASGLYAERKRAQDEVPDENDGDYESCA